MRSGRPACGLLGLWVLVLIGPGCEALHSYRPVGVLVRDIETKQPILGASVRIAYPLTRPSLAPYDSCGKTGEDGVARLRAAPYGEYGIQVGVTAPGYMPESPEFTVAAVRHIEPAHWFEATEHRPADFVVDLYAEPRFSVELIVPAGYRGLIRATVEVQAEVPCAPGQRCFRYEVPPSGVVLVAGPAVLGRVLPAAYRACFADGTPLGEAISAVQVGFRWLKAEGNTQYFVVGTQSDYERFTRELLSRPVEGENSSREGGKTGGRGGRRRRGDPGTPP
jgi:hypothetical protein